MDECVSGQSVPIPTLGETDVIDVVIEDDCDRQSIFLPIGQETAFDLEDLPANHSRRDMIPVYDVRNSISSHYIWNQGYGVLTRQESLGFKVQSNAILQHIVALSKNPSVSLLYPEGQLFPRNFYACRENSVIGALPSFMLHSDVSILALAAEHYLIRLKDGNLSTSRENIYTGTIYLI